MRPLTALFAVLIAVTSYAQVTPDPIGCTGVEGPEADFTLAWDPSVSPDVDVVHIFITETPGVYDLDNTFTEVPVGTEEYTNVAALTDGMYYFAARAWNTAGLESELSNEVCIDLDTPTPHPAPPTNLRIRVLTISDVFLDGKKVETARSTDEFIIDIPSKALAQSLAGLAALEKLTDEPAEDTKESEGSTPSRR